MAVESLVAIDKYNGGRKATISASLKRFDEFAAAYFEGVKVMLPMEALHH